MANLLGAHVIGTVSTEEKAQLAKANGAQHVIISTQEDTVARVKEITNGLGCHAVLDGVGAATWDTSLQAVRRLGTLISFGNASGVVPPVSRFLVIGSSVGSVIVPFGINILLTDPKPLISPDQHFCPGPKERQADETAAICLPRDKGR